MSRATSLAQGRSTRARRLGFAFALALASAAGGAPAHEPADGRSIQYLHVEAGSGTSGGGHAAVRIGDTTYHYVYAEPGLIRSTAESNASFDFAYRALGNRSIHATRIVVSEAGYQALADAFARRHVTQQAQLALLASAEDDQAFAVWLRARRCGAGPTATDAAAPRLKGAGYFTAAAAPTAAGGGRGDTPLVTAAAIARLRAAIESTYGAAYLEEQRRSVGDAIGTLAPGLAPPIELAEWVMPAQADGLAKRYRAFASVAIAIDVLLGARSPDPAAYRVVGGATGQLDAGEIALLDARSRALQSSLVRLAASSRQDCGYPMLLGMARLVALDASRRSGRLVIPDSFDTAARAVPIAELLADAPTALAMLRERRAEYDAARVELAKAAPEDEAAWSRFELSASGLLELQDPMQRAAGAVRAYPDTMLPSRAAGPDASWPTPDADCATLAQWSNSAIRLADALRERLREVYYYDVVARNCVTEIFRTMDAAGTGGVDGTRAELGLAFVPALSAAAVGERYPVVATDTLPSYRRYWLAKLRETQGSARTALLESNTITASLRHPDERDDVFLFYTEEATLLRPLYGAINLGVGAGAMLAGVATLPFDRGRLLTTGARSFAFSVPELAFVSLRKGRNGILPRGWMDATPAPRSE